MNNNIIQEYFLDDINNIFFISSMIILEIIVILWAFLEPIQCFLNTSPIWTAVGIPFLLAVFPLVCPAVLKYLKTKKEKRRTTITIFDRFPKYCPRKYPDDILKTLGLSETKEPIYNIVVLFGESGSGKTTIVNKIKESVIAYEPYETDYPTEIKADLENRQKGNPKIIENVKLLIFDHFEKFVQLKTFGDDENKSIDYIVQLSLTKKILIVIRKEYFAELYWRIENIAKKEDIKCKYIFVENKNDIKDISKYFEDGIEKGENGLSDKEKKIVRKYVDDINNISFVEINAILNLVQGRNGIDDNGSGINIDKLEEGIKTLIIQRLESIFDASEYKDIIFPILYLLCLDYKHQHNNKIVDFINITIDDRNKVLNSVEYLMKLGLIKENKKDDSKGKDSVCYEIAHDYYIEVLNSVLAKKMDQRLCDNIKRYFLYCSVPKFMGVKGTKRYEEWNNKYNRRSKTTKSIEVLLDSTADNAEEKETEYKRTYIIVWYYLIAILIVIGNFVGLLHLGKDYKFLSFAFINLNVSLSYFYSYNWFMHFIARFRGTIFNMRYWRLLLLGVISCVLPYAENYMALICNSNYNNDYVMRFQNLWGLGLGISIISGGIVMLKTRKGVEGEEEKKFFKQRGIIFSFAGFSIACLSVVLNRNPQLDRLLEIGFYLLYMCFIISAIYQHINRRYLKIAVGKTLYWPKGNYWDIKKHNENSA